MYVELPVKCRSHGPTKSMEMFMTASNARKIMLLSAYIKKCTTLRAIELNDT
jgi:hypothetical protein